MFFSRLLNGSWGLGENKYR